MIFHTKMDSHKNRYGIVQPPTPVEEGLPSCHLLQVHKHYVQTTWVGLLSPNIVSTTSSPKTVNIFTDRSRAGEGWSTPYPAFKKKKKKDRFGACLYAFSICSWSLKGQRVCGIVRKLIRVFGSVREWQAFGRLGPEFGLLCSWLARLSRWMVRSGVATGETKETKATWDPVFPCGRYNCLYIDRYIGRYMALETL